jgi:hypothetical protein
MTRMFTFLRGLDAFAAQLLLMERDVDVCDLAAAEAALFGDDPDGDEEDEQGEDTSEPAPAAIAH